MDLGSVSDGRFLRGRLFSGGSGSKSPRGWCFPTGIFEAVANGFVRSVGADASGTNARCSAKQSDRAFSLPNEDSSVRESFQL